jgi:asparagine synthase (glutamine-hydrolysing)
MCGIACFIGRDQQAGRYFCAKAIKALHHRGPDDNGIYEDGTTVLAQTRLSIIDLSPLGHQPMTSLCGRYTMVYNGEVYNHLELRAKYLQNHNFRGHSDTETILELFRLQRERTPELLVGMWSLAIWDKTEQRLFVSRSRFGQKPLYIRYKNGNQLLASEIRPLLDEGEQLHYDADAVAEYLALGNYGHLGTRTFYNDIHHFPEGSYAWLKEGDTSIDAKRYWQLPRIPERDKIPFDEVAKKELHDRVVAAVLSQTLADVPIGITLSGGIDSSIIAGILATYYKQNVHIFTAQATDTKYDETRYVDAVIKKFGAGSFTTHRQNAHELAISKDLPTYINIQEEPFGDPSIIAHGKLMEMASQSGIKVILGGQGADELFFGYSNMARAILSAQLRAGRTSDCLQNLKAMNMGKGYAARMLLETLSPGVEFALRSRSRMKKRAVINEALLRKTNNGLSGISKYDDPYKVWEESLYGVHLPHLVHYDDRNGMAYSIEGRMPFLDHRIAEYVAQIRTTEFLKDGRRKHILREACRQYLPDIIYNRTDKIGFHTPLAKMISKDTAWVANKLKSNTLLTGTTIASCTDNLSKGALNHEQTMLVWRAISAQLWMEEFNII